LILIFSFLAYPFQKKLKGSLRSLARKPARPLLLSGLP
jgi:hypothetical protein